jgi:hypothetical protein
VRIKPSISDVTHERGGHLAKLGPGLEVLVVDLLSDVLHVELGHVRHDGAQEASLDVEELLKEIVDGTLGYWGEREKC